MEYENKYASRGVGGTALGLSIGVAFWIGSSDLPLWVKFLLLK